MEELVNGYRRFREKRWPVEKAVLASLARHGQRPHTLAIACSDSRVAPEIIFDVAAGDIFSVRNIANLVPRYAPDPANHGVSAAIEFAVCALHVKRIAVIGHSLCGGIGALLSGPPAEAPDFVANWMRIAEPAKVAALRAHQDDHHAARHTCEIEAVRLSLSNLQTFPFVASAAQKGELIVVGFYFDVVTGRLSQVSPDRLLPIGNAEAGHF